MLAGFIWIIFTVIAIRFHLPWKTKKKQISTANKNTEYTCLNTAAETYKNGELVTVWFIFWLKYLILTIKTAFLIHNNKWVIELTTETQQYHFAELKCTPHNCAYKHHLHVYITL